MHKKQSRSALFVIERRKAGVFHKIGNSLF